MGRPLSRSSLVTVLSPELATHANLKPSLTPRGASPTVIGWPVIVAVDGSMRVTELSPLLVTQTVDLPTKMPVGWLPTPIGGPRGVGGARARRVGAFVPRVGPPPSRLPGGGPPRRVAA